MACRHAKAPCGADRGSRCEAGREMEPMSFETQVVPLEGGCAAESAPWLPDGLVGLVQQWAESRPYPQLHTNLIVDE